MVHEIMLGAAKDALEAYEINKDRQPSFRMSRAGLPLVQQVLEDFVFPKLPVITDVSKQDGRRKLKSQMSISTGHLYSKAIAVALAEEYPDYELRSEHQLEWRGITGTCDHLLIDHAYQRILVVECKALGCKTLTEAKETKLTVDNWGYLTQLALYMMAVVEAYPNITNVEGQWRVWCKPIERSFTHRWLWGKQVADIAYRADHRHGRYKEVAEALQHKGIERVQEILIDSLDDDPLPLKGHTYGYSSASCGLHFHPWHTALLDDDGMPYKNFSNRLFLILSYITGQQENQTKVLNLLDNSR